MKYATIIIRSLLGLIFVLFDIFMAKAFNPLGAAVAAFVLFLLYAYRKNYHTLICPGVSCKS